MDVTIQPSPIITWRTIGGILDFYVLTGPTPNDVITQYFDLIGRPHLPPYWAFGFHLCRWGYGSAEETWEVVKRTRLINFPQEVSCALRFELNIIAFQKEYVPSRSNAK